MLSTEALRHILEFGLGVRNDRFGKRGRGSARRIDVLHRVSKRTLTPTLIPGEKTQGIRSSSRKSLSLRSGAKPTVSNNRRLLSP